MPEHWSFRFLTQASLGSPAFVPFGSTDHIDSIVHAGITPGVDGSSVERFDDCDSAPAAPSLRPVTAHGVYATPWLGRDGVPFLSFHAYKRTDWSFG